jgi:hypothetical protein
LLSDLVVLAIGIGLDTLVEKARLDLSLLLEVAAVLA